MPDPATPSGAPSRRSPLDLIPGLVTVAELMTDAVAVTDMQRRLIVWNTACDRLYGIPSTDALGRRIDDLYVSKITGEGTSSAGARTIALASGSWRGRVTDRPSIGRLAGQELVIETILSRIDGPDGRPIGIISVKRDVTAGVRVERELSTVISLATPSGESRNRHDAAEHALEVLVTTTGATMAGILMPGPDGGISVMAHRGMSPGALTAVTSAPWSVSPAFKAVVRIGRVVKGAVALLPMLPASRRALLESHVRTLVFVGLHRESQQIGVLALGWDLDDPVLPSDAVILLAASHIARCLENARLVEEIVQRAQGERKLVQRLRALDELTRVGGRATTIEEHAERSARLINTSLGASGTAYGLLAADGESYATINMADVRPTLAAWLAAARPDQRTAFRRWRNGEGPFLEPFEPGHATAETLALAREAGVTAYAAIPIRVETVVVGGIAAYFDRPFADLHLDRTTLERIATVVSISLENFRLRGRSLASEQRYRSIFEASPDPILIITPEGSVVDLNEAALRQYRADRTWLLGQQVTDLARFDLETVRTRAAALGIAQTFRTKAVGVRQDGGEFSAEVEIAAVELDGERRYLVRVRDLADQELLQAELVQAQKMEATGQLVSGVAHELNNPLAAILGFSELIRRDTALPEDLRHNADLLVEEAARTRRIVQNLLDFARQRPPERYPTSIRALVDSVLVLQSYSLGKGLIEAEVDIPDDLPTVDLDRSRLQQVLVNLTHNAIYAIRRGDGTRLRITASTEGPADAERVRVTVMDDGPGVAPENVEHLFEPFFTTKPPSDGTGLGLSVSYGIVASHGGELRYGPSALGRGAAFTFDLPVRAAATDAFPTTSAVLAAPVAPLTPPTPPIQSRRVLVLDDEESIRVFLEKALAALGYEPVVTSSGEEAVERAADGPYLAILCDHQMPGKSGVQVYDAIVAVEPALGGRFVMMSGDMVNPALSAFAASHGVTVLSKPFDLETLDRAIQGAGGVQPRG